MSLDIRRATPNDFAALLWLDHSASEPGRRAWIEEALNVKEVVVALRDDEAVGYGVLDVFFGHPFVSLIYVTPSSRRAGAGEALARHFSDRDADKVFSSTNLSNAPMLALFRKLGWRYAGTVDHLDEDDPEVFFVRVRTRP